MEEFHLDGHKFIELNSLLKLTGKCSSGGTAKLVIADGNVTVDGQIELRKRCKIYSGHVVEFAGQQITVKE